MKGLGINLGGRPYFVADIPHEIDEETELIERFYKATKDFKYRDMAALSRHSNVHYQTVINWKYLRTTPRWGIMLAIIQWVRSGKPMGKVNPSHKPFVL